MSRTRRTRLARQLAETGALSYQQALIRLEAYVAEHGRLPRTVAELNAARHTETVGSPAATVGSEPDGSVCAFCGIPATVIGVYLHNAGATTYACDRHAAELLTPYPLDVSTLLRAANTVERTGSFTIRSSVLRGCPHLVMGVDHWLPTGECAHEEPTCPTCLGHGQLATTDGPVPCDRSAPVPAGVPVCDGTGRWSGTRR